MCMNLKPTWGGTNILLERGNKPVKGAGGGGGVDVEMGEVATFLLYTLQFNHIYCV